MLRTEIDVLPPSELMTEEHFGINELVVLSNFEL